MDSEERRSEMKRSELFEAPVTAERGVVLATVELLLGDAGPLHMHPGDEVLYVVEGSVVVEVDGQQPRTVRAGESFQFPRATPHLARNVSDRPARVLASIVYIGGEPSTVMVAAQPAVG
jgi:quercetin dioxygenase-like cupin family protein